MGFIAGICYLKIIQGIRDYFYKKRTKNIVIKCSTPEEFENAIKEVIKDIDKTKSGDKKRMILLKR